MNGQPKKIFRPVSFSDTERGFARRLSYGRTITLNETEIPKALEYEDIDDAFNEFVDKELDLVDNNGKRVPYFTLYSNQRFSEYSQTWEHTDEDGNLLMNFKTVNRRNNPNAGTGQGGAWNIPGERRFTTHMKTVLDDNGDEHVEVYSMKQPYNVDLYYRVNFVTNTYEMINRFNERVHDLFKSRQCYIRPNGHFIPMVLEEVNDETTYSIEERKFFVQSIVVKAMAYIIHEEDFDVKKYPKRVKLYDSTKQRRPKSMVDIEEKEGEDNYAFKSLDLRVMFAPGENKVEFTMDTDMVVQYGTRDNITDVRVSINGTPIFIEKGFSIKNGDNVKVRMWSADYRSPSVMVFSGYAPNVIYDEIAPEDVRKDDTSEILEV